MIFRTNMNFPRKPSTELSSGQFWITAISCEIPLLQLVSVFMTEKLRRKFPRAVAYELNIPHTPHDT